MKLPPWIWLCSTLFLASCASAAAHGPQDESPTTGLARVAESGVLRVGLSGNQPPFNMKDRDGNLMGMEIDLVNAMALAIDVKVQFVEKPFKELLPALEKGEVDIVMSGMTITPRRNMRVAFVGPYQLSGKSILTKSTKMSTFATMADLDRPEMKLGVLEGSTSEGFVRSVLPQATVVPVDNYDAGVEAILGDEITAFVADRPILVVTMLKNPDSNLLISNTPLTVEPIGIAVPAGDPLLLNFLQNTMGAMEMAGLVADIEQRWTSDASWVDRLP